MKLFVPALLILYFSVLTAIPSHAIEAGQTAPGFSVPSKSGDILTLEKLKGNVVFLDIWASWCSSCKQSFPWINELQNKFEKQGLKVVTISVDESQEVADKFMRKMEATFPVGYDPEGSVPQAYGIVSMPTSFLIDRDGKVISVHNGLTEAHRQSIEREISHRLSS